jgi:hypothetical protein
LSPLPPGASHSAGAASGDPPATTIPRSDVDRVAEIQREIWRAAEPVTDILARHGLTEAAWRDLKKQTKAPR